MSQIQQITKENFEAEVLNSLVPVLVDLYATWCMPCKLMGQVLERLAPELAGRAKIVKIDTDQEPELAAAFRVSSIPTLVLMNGGRAVDVQVGMAPPAQIVAMLDRIAPRDVAACR